MKLSEWEQKVLVGALLTEFESIRTLGDDAVTEDDIATLITVGNLLKRFKRYYRFINLQESIDGIDRFLESRV